MRKIMATKEEKEKWEDEHPYLSGIIWLFGSGLGYVMGCLLGLALAGFCILKFMSLLSWLFKQ